MIEVVIVAAKRTPMGGFQGILSPLTATELGAQAIAASLASIGLSAGEPDEVYMGCVLPAGLKQAPARQAAIKAGIPDSVPTTTVNKVCGSGMKSLMLAADQIRTGAIQSPWPVAWNRCPTPPLCSTKRAPVIAWAIRRSMTICF